MIGEWQGQDPQQVRAYFRHLALSVGASVAVHYAQQLPESLFRLCEAEARTIGGNVWNYFTNSNPAQEYYNERGVVERRNTEMVEAGTETNDPPAKRLRGGESMTSGSAAVISSERIHYFPYKFPEVMHWYAQLNWTEDFSTNNGKPMVDSVSGFPFQIVTNSLSSPLLYTSNEGATLT